MYSRIMLQTSLRNSEKSPHLHTKWCCYSHPPSADYCAAGILREQNKEKAEENGLHQRWKSGYSKSAHSERGGEGHRVAYINRFQTDFALNEQKSRARRSHTPVQ